MSEFLSPEWVEAHVAASASLPERPGATATMAHEIVRKPDPKVVYVLEWVDGRVVSATVGAADDADLTVITPLDVAVELATGALDPSLAFMRGQTKVVGDMGKYVSLLPLTQHDDYAAMVAA